MSTNGFNEDVHWYVNQEGDYRGAIRIWGTQSAACKRRGWLMTENGIYVDAGYWQATSIRFMPFKRAVRLSARQARCIAADPSRWDTPPTERQVRYFETHRKTAARA